MLRHLELVVDQWPIGHQNETRHMGDRFFIDENAAFILVGMGKAKYLDENDNRYRDKVMTTEASEPLVRQKRRYNRRDMKAKD